MSCNWMKDGKCGKAEAIAVYGDRPSAGVCGMCPHYEGPPREPVQVRVPPLIKEPPKKNLVQKAASWIKAEASQIVEGPLDDERYQKRIDTCLACPRLQRSEEPGKVGWCKSCGCGQNVRAELTVKARMPKATCPVNAWDKGDTQGR